MDSDEVTPTRRATHRPGPARPVPAAPNTMPAMAPTAAPVATLRSVGLRSVGVLSIGAVAALGAIAATASVANEQNLAQRRDEIATDLATSAVGDRISAALGSLPGTDGLAADGSVSEREFSAYADDVLRTAPFSSIARESIVPASTRADFEREQGITIREGSAADAPPALPRAEHLPVTQVIPLTDANREVLGFDIASDPTRAAAAALAAQEDRPVVSRPIRLASSARPGVFLVRPVRDRSGSEPRLVGFISTGIAADDFVTAARRVLPPGTRLGLTVDGERIAGDDVTGSPSRSLSPGQGDWVVSADDPEDADTTVPLAILSATIALAMALLVLLRRQRDLLVARDRLAARSRDSAERSDTLAALARRLSFATSADQVIDAMTDLGPATAAASATAVGQLHRPGRLLMTRRGDVPDGRASIGGALRDPSTDDAPVGTGLGAVGTADEPAGAAPPPAARELSLDDPNPACEAARRGEVVIADGSDAPVVASPMFDSAGEVMGVVEFAWTDGVDIADADLASIETVARMCGQALRRTELNDRTTSIAELTTGLAATATEAGVASLVAEHAQRWLGCAWSGLYLYDGTGALAPIAPTTASSPTPAPDGAIAVAVAGDTPAVFEDRDALVARHAAGLGLGPADPDRPDADAPTTSTEAAAVWPIHRSDGTPVGAVVLTWDHAVRFDAGRRANLRSLADVVAPTVERVVLGRQAERDARRRQLVAEIGEALASSGSTAEIVAALEARAPSLISGGTVRIELGPARSTDLPATVIDGHDSGATLPLFDSARRRFGSIRFSWPRARRIDAATLALLHELGAITSGALERVTLSELHRHREAGLNELVAGLAVAVTPMAIAAEVAARCPGLVGCVDVVVSVLDDTIPALIPFDVTSPPGEPERPIAVRSMAVDADHPAAEALRTGRTVPLPDQASADHRFPPGDRPEGGGEPHPPGTAASVHLPLRDAEARTLGVVSIYWADDIDLDPGLSTLLTTVADLIGQTLERADLYEREHLIVATMQQRLLAPLPRIDGYELASVYEPASASVGIGGDWYEGFATDDGLVLVVGDVVGHGVEAVVSMAQTQYVVAGLLHSGTPLGHVFARANEMLLRDSTMYSTAQLFHIDRDGDRIGYVNAGHPWAALRLPDGTVQLLSGARQPMLGTSIRAVDLAYEPFPVGSMLLAYTDGLIERRGEAITVSMDRLVHVLRDAPDDVAADVLLGELVARLKEADPTNSTYDDVAAVLVIRRT